MALTRTVFVLLLAASQATAKGIDLPEHICASSCNLWSSYINWTIPRSGARCTDNVKLRSIYACAQAYCSTSDIYSGLEALGDQCTRPLPAFEPIPQENLTLIPRLSQSVYADEPVSELRLPDQQWFNVAHRTLWVYWKNFWDSYDFSWASYGFWSFVFFISMVNRSVHLIKVWRARPATQRTQSGGPWTWIRRQLVLPATAGKHCREPLGWVVLPPRLETLIIVTYIVMSVVMCFPSYDLFDENLYWFVHAEQLGRYVADRTGLLSIANVPILWLFSSRNDPLLWLTSFSYATFNRFHRWVAILSFIFALVHSIVWTYNYLYFYGSELYVEAYQEVWWWTGVVATIIMAIMLPLSVYWLRRRHYEFFLVVHILLSVVFLVTLYFHCKIFDDAFDGFTWACVAIWAIDRTMRVARTTYNSIIPRFKKGIKATATYDQKSEIIRLDVSDFFSGISTAPGHYYYVYVPASIKGWESHPFTLCSWTRSANTSSASINESMDGKDIEKSFETHSEPSTVSDAVSKQHSFLIRPYTGFTQRLRDKIVAKGGTSTEMTVLLEGPYGRKLDLSNHSDVLIIATGTGIVTAVSHAHYLLGKGRTDVHVNWIVPQRQFAHSLCQNEYAALLDDPRFSLTVHVTGQVRDTEEDKAVDKVEYLFGRPDIFTIMQEARANCKIDLAVIDSGTAQVADVCRASVVKLLKEDGPRVDYYAIDTPW